MKANKIISLTAAVAMVMTSGIISSAPAVSAASDSTTFIDDFESYTVNDTYANTGNALAANGWYWTDEDTVFTNTKVEPYKTFTSGLKVVNYDGRNCLQLDTPNADKTYNNYGLGRYFPGQDKTASGVWEINFKFHPYPSGKVQFNFSMNTADGSAKDTTVAQHNIVSAYDNKMYIGHRDYMTLYTKKITQGTISENIGSNWWYDVKTIVNCDARYYSVEIKHGNNLVARRCPISFDESETIGFLKLSALGMGSANRIYIDDVSITKTTGEALIYEDDFDSYTSTTQASAGMSTGNGTEVLTGDSYFKYNTPWRYNTSVGKSYTLENDTILNSHVVRLGDLASTPDTVDESGLVYLQVGEYLVTPSSETARGMLKTSFKIKPETIVDDVTVNVIPNMSYDIADSSRAMFKITNNAGTPYIVNGSEHIPISSSKWYQIELLFDVNDRVEKTDITDIEASETASFSTGDYTIPGTIKGIMFKVDGGSSVLMDDIKLEYYMPEPSVDIGSIVLKDNSGKTIPSTSNVATALKTIEIPVGTFLDEATANDSTILIKNSRDEVVPYTASISEPLFEIGDIYTLELTEPLEQGETYTVTVPSTVANVLGDPLGKTVTFSFETGALSDLMRLSSVTVGGKDVKSLSGITAGATVNVTYECANSSAEDVNGTAILAFYDDNKAISVLTGDEISGTDDKGFAFTVPSELDMETVDDVSVFLWDGFDDITPISRTTDFIRKDEVTEKYEDYVDFIVNIEGDRDAVILQLTDTQIQDTTQIREDNIPSPTAMLFWQPELMNDRLFDDLDEVIEGVNPDLILLTGDLVYGKYDDTGTSFKRLADFLDSYDIPWAPVFGNHDNESKKGADWQCDYFESCENCLFKQRTLTGNCNYNIGIVQGGKLKRVIFMLDSNGCGAMSAKTFANGHSKKTSGFGDDQIAWYTSAANKINSEFEDIKYTFVFHIQLAAFADAFTNTYGFNNDADRKLEDPGRGDFVSPINIDEREDKKDTDFGYIGRPLKGPSDSDYTVYNGMKALGADSILVGHEHCNSASVVYDGVRFQYGQKIGEYDRINFRSDEGTIIGSTAFNTSYGTPILGGTVMKLSENTGEISDAYIYYCDK